MSYLGMSIPHPLDVFPSDRFISIAVPTYCRPFYLKKLLDTLEQTADMFYEVIVYDDGSPKELQDQVYAMRDRISLLTFNTGYNMGLCAAANYVVKLASSRYILFLNDDCFFTAKCLRDICNVLSKHYVGIVSPMNDVGPLSDKEGVCTVNKTRFALSNLLGGGSTMAFRKDVWQEVGGFDERSTSGQADNVFVYKVLRAGYWKALMEGPGRVQVGNFVYGNDYKPTQGFSRGNDCSIPRIFGMPEKKWVEINQTRRIACQYWVDSQRTIPNRHTYDTRPNPDQPLKVGDPQANVGLNDISFWGDHFLRMFGNRHSSDIHTVDWEVAKIFGQDRWRAAITEDFKSA